jgi:hypothetical protein
MNCFLEPNLFVNKSTTPKDSFSSNLNEDLEHFVNFCSSLSNLEQ